MSRAADRQISFADWELLRQGLRLEPLLPTISDFLEERRDVIEQVRCGLTRGPHTDRIKRGKVQTPIEFGHKVFLSENARGLITRYEVLDGNPVDEQHVIPSLQRHRRAFGHAPELYGSDRGFFSEENVTSCKQDGVKVVCIPQRGGTKTPEREAYERSSEFKDGQRFRAGIEGRISVLFRGRGVKRCLAEGRECA